MTVGVEAERQFAPHLLLDVVAVLFGLLPAQSCVLAGSFRFDHSQWFAIFAEQDIVAELMPFVLGSWLLDAGRQADRDIELFNDLGRVFDVPARLAEGLVDQR